MEHKSRRNNDKPPLGIIPRWLWFEHRLYDLLTAMGRYQQACIKIPDEWIEEKNLLFRELRGRRVSRYSETHHVMGDEALMAEEMNAEPVYAVAPSNQIRTGWTICMNGMIDGGFTGQGYTKDMILKGWKFYRHKPYGG